MLSDPATLEPFDPAAFGGERRLVFGTATGTMARANSSNARVSRPTTRLSSFKSTLAERGPFDLDEALTLATREFGD